MFEGEVRSLRHGYVGSKSRILDSKVAGIGVTHLPGQRWYWAGRCRGFGGSDRGRALPRQTTLQSDALEVPY